jgi:hypothetical protein
MFMKTLLEDIDDLDRMVDAGATKDAIRSQIRLIAREVAAMQTSYVSLAEAHSDLQHAQAERDAELARLKAIPRTPDGKVRTTGGGSY